MKLSACVSPPLLAWGGKARSAPQQCLYFFPLPQGQRALRPSAAFDMIRRRNWPSGRIVARRQEKKLPHEGGVLRSAVFTELRFAPTGKSAHTQRTQTEKRKRGWLGNGLSAQVNGVGAEVGQQRVRCLHLVNVSAGRATCRIPI